jgi:hypothetical protein
MDRASSDVGFMFTAFNLRCLINHIGAGGFRDLSRILLLFRAFCMLILTQKRYPLPANVSFAIHGNDPATKFYSQYRSKYFVHLES